MTKADKSKIIDSWAILNSLMSYYEHPEHYTGKFKPEDKVLKAYQLLDSVVSKMDE